MNEQNILRIACSVCIPSGSVLDQMVLVARFRLLAGSLASTAQDLLARMRQQLEAGFSEPKDSGRWHRMKNDSNAAAFANDLGTCDRAACSRSLSLLSRHPEGVDHAWIACPLRRIEEGKTASEPRLHGATRRHGFHAPHLMNRCRRPTNEHVDLLPRIVRRIQTLSHRTVMTGIAGGIEQFYGKNCCPAGIAEALNDDPEGRAHRADYGPSASTTSATHKSDRRDM